MKQKPSIVDYEAVGGYERWRQDMLVWCAETMSEAADQMERTLFDRPTPQPESHHDRWYWRFILSSDAIVLLVTTSTMVVNVRANKALDAALMGVWAGLWFAKTILDVSRLKGERS